MGDYPEPTWNEQEDSFARSAEEKERERIKRVHAIAAVEQTTKIANDIFGRFFKAQEKKDAAAMKKEETALNVATAARDKAIEVLKALGPAPAEADGVPNLYGHGGRRTRKHNRRSRKTRPTRGRASRRRV